MNTETKAKATETPQPQAPLTVSPSTVVPSGAGKYFDALAYEAIAAGQPVASVTPAALGVMTVPNPSSFPVVRLASAPTYWQVVGIAANAAQPGQPVKVITSDPSLGFGTVAIGDVIYLGLTAGAVTSTYADLITGNVVVVLGVGVAVGKINMAIISAGTPK